MTGKGPIGVRWIDVNKQDEEHLLYRSRLVAKDFNTEDRPYLFKSTPPIGAMRFICSEAAANMRTISV